MLSQRMQARIIHNLCDGREPDPGFNPRDLNEPWFTLYLRLVRLPLNERRTTTLAALANLRSRDPLITFSIASKAGDGPLNFPSLADLAGSLPAITWLWEGWIPSGMLSLLGAVPGAGKSYVALDLARRLMAGLPFPDGTLPPQELGPTTNVVYVDAEALPQLMSDRTNLWQMDCRKLFPMLPRLGHVIDFCRSASRERLIEIVHAAQPALIVVDSLSSVSSKGENSIKNMRQVLGFLNDLAADARCALLVIHHLRKRSPMAASDRPLSVDDFRGSSHIMAVARSVLGLSVIQTTPHPDPSGPRRLEVVKSNLARPPQPLGLELCPAEPGGIVLRYSSEPPLPYRPPNEIQQCAAWLLDTLRDSGAPIPPNQLVDLAALKGFSERTLYRARRQLGSRVVDTAGHKHPRNTWALPEQL